MLNFALISALVLSASLTMAVPAPSLNDAQAALDLFEEQNEFGQRMPCPFPPRLCQFFPMFAASTTDEPEEAATPTASSSSTAAPAKRSVDVADLEN